MKKKSRGDKADIETLKSEMSEVKSVLRRVAVNVANLTESVEGMRRDFPTRAEMNARFDAVDRRMDASAAALEDSRFRWAVHADTLLNHDQRIKWLEAHR